MEQGQGHFRRGCRRQLCAGRGDGTDNVIGRLLHRNGPRREMKTFRRTEGRRHEIVVTSREVVMDAEGEPDVHVGRWLLSAAWCVAFACRRGAPGRLSGVVNLQQPE